MIYLDNSATTKPYPEAIAAYAEVAATYFGNPSSLHTLGVQAEGIMIEARKRIAAALAVEACEIIFTSGGTEGNNMAIRGTVHARKKRGNHLITSTIEHPSVLNVYKELENEGFEVSYINVDETGRIKLDELYESLRNDTILVSLIHVNNETGVIQPVQEVGELLKAFPNAYFHVDHIQGFSKVPLDLINTNIHLCTYSAHKIHGLKGNGILYIRKKSQIKALVQGGEQEQKLRAGTENVAGIVAMAKAVRLVEEARDKKLNDLLNLRNELCRQLSTINGVVINTPVDHSAPHIVNFSIPTIKPEVFIQSLAEKQIYISTRSACSSKVSEPSHVLLAMGLSEQVASSAVRVSLSYQTTTEEIDIFVKEVRKILPEIMEVIRS